MACTLTLTRLGPSLVSNSVSAAISLSSSLSMRSASRRGCPGGNISVTRRPRKCPAGAPRNFSAAGLIITARASRVNKSKPSSSPAITEFMFSRMVLKISCTPRSCWPTCVIFRLTRRSFGGSGDELGLVSREITQVGQQLRGVHEIFSTMRENMNSVMAGLEDGLLLFTRDARAVMIGPAAEKFLGAPAGHFLGRRVTEIFPPGHPLHQALHIESDELSEVAAETELETGEGPKRVCVTVQAIQED